MNIIALFIMATAINVVLSTARSIITIKGNAFVAGLANAICFGFYTYVIILTNVDSLGTVEKMIITAVCNFVGVFIVKLIEKKLTKNKLWKIDCTIYSANAKTFEEQLKSLNIPYYYNEYGKHTMFSMFTETQNESETVAELVKGFKGKYFITENRSLLY